MRATIKSSKSILIVDDEPLLRECLRELFEAQNCRVFESSDGAHALAFLEHERVDVLLTDIDMPKMDGFELLKNLRLKKFETPIFLMSGNTSFSRDELLKIGAAGFFEKPFFALADMIRTVTSYGD